MARSDVGNPSAAQQPQLRNHLPVALEGEGERGALCDEGEQPASEIGMREATRRIYDAGATSQNTF